MPNDRYTRLRFLKGTSLDDCFALVERADDENFRDTEYMDWSLFHLSQGKRLPILAGQGEADDLWVSPTGVVYLIARPNEGYGLHVGRPTATGYSWIRQDSVVSETTYVQYVWGASEEAVIAWGGGILNPSNDPTVPPVRLDLPTCWMGSGDTWKQQSAPGRIHGVGGDRLEALIAVGEHGLVARWDGHTWEKEPGPSSMDLHFVQILPTGEIYGASYNGRVFKRTEAGWKEVGEHLGHIYGFTYWEGKLLVATGHGIYRVEGDTLAVERPHVEAYLIVAGARLLWADESVIYEVGGPTERSMALAEIFEE